MQRTQLRATLEALSRGETSVDEALEALAGFPELALGYAHLDTHRPLRTGQPEVVFGQSKTAEQIAGILDALRRHGQDGLVTRLDAAKAEAILARFPEASWHPVAGVLHLRAGPAPEPVGLISVITAGTSDLPVAEEAAVVAEALGDRVQRVYDVGVAGIHRLLGRIDQLRRARAHIVVAGMEGALASVVAGLVDRPVIGVPTSVGYGASFGGLSALLGMLNACAPGISVVNIDNGFGAAMQASLINRMAP